MNLSMLKPRNAEPKFWLLILAIYGIPNLLMYLSTVDAPVFNVDTKPIWSRLNFSTSLICITLVFLSLLFVFLCARLGSRFFPVEQPRLPPKIMGVLVFLIQLNGLLVVLLLDFGRVGGTSTSALALFVSYLSPDAVFLLFYGHSRNRKVPYLNLALFIASNLLRGWGGVWSMLFMIEFYYAAQRLSNKKMWVASLMLVTTAMFALPFLIEARDKARGTQALEEMTYGRAVTTVLERLQQFTAVELIAQEAPVIARAIGQGHILPFYADNQVAEKLMPPTSKSVSLQKVLSVRYLISSDEVPRGYSADDFGWYVHTGIAGWLFVLDWRMIPLYLLFVGALVVFPYWISARFIGARSLLPVLHTVSILYVFHGWFSVQIGFCIALTFYAGVMQFLRPPARRYAPAAMVAKSLRVRS